MSDLLTRAELIKLSRVLGADEGQLSFLAGLGVEPLRRLEDRISNALFNEHRDAFQRLADAGKLLPASLIAKMSELVFGPVLSARVSGLFEPQRAIEVATRLKTPFLADVTVEMDPRSASDLLKRMPAQIIVQVALLLLKRKEYVTMGRFVDDLTDEAIKAVTASITDDTALVRIGIFVERPERLVEVIDLLPQDRIQRVINAVATGPREVQEAGLAMMSRFTPELQGRFGEAAIALGPKVLNALIGAAQAPVDADLREQGIAVVAAVMQNVSAAGRSSFAKMLAGMDEKALSLWARSTTEAGLWLPALKILAASNAEVQQQAAAALARLDKAGRAAVADALRKSGLSKSLGPLQSALS